MPAFSAPRRFRLQLALRGLELSPPRRAGIEVSLVEQRVNRVGSVYSGGLETEGTGLSSCFAMCSFGVQARREPAVAAPRRFRPAGGDFPRHGNLSERSRYGNPGRNRTRGPRSDKFAALRKRPSRVASARSSRSEVGGGGKERLVAALDGLVGDRDGEVGLAATAAPGEDEVAVHLSGVRPPLRRACHDLSPPTPMARTCQATDSAPNSLLEDS